MLMFTYGQTVGAQRCTVISAFDDPLYEVDETFTIALTTLPDDQGLVRFTEGENVTTVTILRDLNDSMLAHAMAQQHHDSSYMIVHRH